MNGNLDKKNGFLYGKSRRGRAVRGLYGGVWVAGLAGAGPGRPAWRWIG